jgi:hypothetical protein
VTGCTFDMFVFYTADTDQHPNGHVGEFRSNSQALFFCPGGAKRLADALHKHLGGGAVYKLHPAELIELESAWFQPLHLQCMYHGFKIICFFKRVNLYRYAWARARLIGSSGTSPRGRRVRRQRVRRRGFGSRCRVCSSTVGLYKLSPVQLTQRLKAPGFNH